MRVLLKIQKSDPPRLDHPNRWSKEFNDFLKHCLVKDPHKRPSVEDLLKHPFIREAVDKKPLLDLLAEFKAEIINEEEMDVEEEVNIKTVSICEPLCLLTHVSYFNHSYLHDASTTVRVTIVHSNTLTLERDSSCSGSYCTRTVGIAPFSHICTKKFYTCKTQGPQLEPPALRQSRVPRASRSRISGVSSHSRWSRIPMVVLDESGELSYGEYF